jgi:hypothetical protein
MNHPCSKPISCGKENAEWADDFEKCGSCAYWFHVDDEHQLPCIAPPVPDPPITKPSADLNLPSSEHSIVEGTKIRNYKISRRIFCGKCGENIRDNSVSQLVSHYRDFHRLEKPITRSGAGKDMWEDHFLQCPSCWQWFHIDESHPASCSDLPVDYNEDDYEALCMETTPMISSSSETPNVAVQKIPTGQSTKSRSTETKTLKCSN